MRQTILGVVFVAALSVPSHADDALPFKEADLDASVAAAMQAFETPGVSVGVVKDGKLVFSKGYGIANVETGAPVTPDTIFGIASHTKAYTAAALAMLIDEGKLSWNDRVIDHIPEFRMSDAWVTREFTIKDLLTHRSGLDLGAGDLLIFPEVETSRQEIIMAMRHLKPVSSFRDKFDYDNLLYIIAGEVVGRVSGMPWEEFIEKRIFAPLQMDSCRALPEGLSADAPRAYPHMTVDGKLTVTKFDKGDPTTAAGSINCSLTDHAKWVAVQLNGGKMADGTPLFSEARHKEMWTPITPLGGDAFGRPPYNTHFKSYGLGWFLDDMNGQLHVYHSGGLIGMVTYTNLLPEESLGVIVFTNNMNGYTMRSLTNELLDAYLGVDNGDWVEQSKKDYAERLANADKVVAEAKAAASGAKSKAQKADAYTGTYRDAWYGDMVVTAEKGKLRMTSKRSAQLKGDMVHFNRDTFIVRWDDRTLDADAYATFQFGPDGKPTKVEMKPVSPLTDFSFDFQHLDLQRVQE
ncbi:serine hydrolase [Gimibacter soli]|uniref:Serine hydrolase n=1 Tax=Gimibacter soli TaxID=3024400 RepID=A0AAF0BM50_9PROT|nr:serine hydrolase [Gimibacter soli]WCL54046.1 serine hydrolase [Gimibacter soli]